MDTQDFIQKFTDGLKIEMEHSETVHGDLVVVGKIVLDHLAEDIDYYSKLKAAKL